VFATVVVTKKSCYQVNDFARIVKKMEENVDDAIVLFQKDFMGKEMTFDSSSGLSAVRLRD
jgi:thiamine monophosphate synthase